METTTFFPTLKVGDRGPAVIDLQSLLNHRFAGNPVGGVIDTLRLDGLYGPKTEAAVRIAQFRYLLFQDGIAGPRTWESIKENSALINQLPVVNRGDQGKVVVVLQTTLDPQEVGPIDAIFGPRTEAAVKAYQVASKIYADGIVGLKTWAALEQRAQAQLV